MSLCACLSARAYLRNCVSDLALSARYAEQGLCNGRVSVRPSRRSTAAAVCGGFAAERGQQMSIDSDRNAAQALSSKCGQRRVESRGTRLNTACLCMRLCRLVTGTGHNYRIARCHLPQSTDHTYATVDDFQASSLQFTRTARNSVLLGARRCRSTSPACTHGAQQQTRRTTGQTDRRTLERFTNSASHTMRTV